MTDISIQRMCIIGVGLIGGSLALAARNAGCCADIIGAGRSEGNLRKAKELGAIDDYTTDLKKAVNGADVVVLAVPVGQMSAVMADIKDSLKKDCIVTDVGSSKRAVIAAAKDIFADNFRYFVPGHPIAGTERSGVEASVAELFDGRRVILTPVSETDPGALEKIRQLWLQIKAHVVVMDAEHHDEVLAATSHLPHLLAYSLVDSLASLHEKSEIFEYAAGGFRDFTRIASSNPQMWHDICMSNRDAILKMLSLFQQDLARLGDAIRDDDGDAVKEIFNRAKAARDQFCGD